MLTFIREVLKKYNYTIIKPSIFWDDESNINILFNAYRKDGVCYNFFISFDDVRPYARKQPLSMVCIHDSEDITKWFFN